MKASSLSLVDSVLAGRIDEAISALPATENSTLNQIKCIPSLPERLAAFCDYMIEHTSSLSLAIKSKRPSLSKQARIANDYRSACELTGAREGELAAAVSDLRDTNLRLQRLHNQDRAILLKQSDLIQSMRATPAPESHSLKNDFGEISDELEKLENDVKTKLRRIRT